MNRAARIQKAALQILAGESPAAITTDEQELTLAANLAEAIEANKLKTLARQTMRHRVTESAKRSTICRIPAPILRA